MSYLRFLMEDILRLAKEKKNPTLEDISSDTGMGREDLKRAIKELEDKNLIDFKDNRITLTEKGEKIAKLIYDYHRVAENTFGHRVAHSLEHLGKEDIEKAKKLGKNAVPINDFKEGGSGVIALLEVEDPRILSRLIGIGLTIGAKFTVLKIRNKELILSVNGRPVIIDRDLGKYILGARR